MTADGTILRGSAAALDWQLPLPPVRFPLRDALLSFQDHSRPPSVGSAQQEAAAAAYRGPLKVVQTQKSRALRDLGKRRRAGKEWSGRAEAAPLQAPQAPPEAYAARPAKKALHSMATTSKHKYLQHTEAASRCSWVQAAEAKDEKKVPAQGGMSLLSHSQSDSAVGSAQAPHRSTLTSVARTVLSHVRRTQSELSMQGGGEHSQALAATWHSTLRPYPKLTREWLAKGHEFTDGGLGIGPRFKDHDRRYAPGPGAYQGEAYGSVSRWVGESCQPTKQPDARHTSTEAHKMGARRDTAKTADRARPGPGAYELKGFAEEILQNAARRPRPQAPHEDVATSAG